jgi:hypothetical protein
MPLAGAKAFRLTVRFEEGASDVISVFVTALARGGEEVARWGYGVKPGGGTLWGDEDYVWHFAPGQPVGEQFWVIPGSAVERATVDLFFDVEPDREVRFAVRADAEP